MDNTLSQSGIIRQTPLVLLSKLLVLEIIFVVMYLLVRAPKLIFPEFVSSDMFVTLSGISLIFFVITTLIQMFFVVFISLSWANEQYEIRTNDLIHRKGVFSLKEDAYSLRNIESITIEQGLVGKLFNFGDIRFFSPVLKREYYMTNISSPMKHKEQVEKIVHKARSSKHGERIIPRVEDY